MPSDDSMTDKFRVTFIGMSIVVWNYLNAPFNVRKHSERYDNNDVILEVVEKASMGVLWNHAKKFVNFCYRFFLNLCVLRIKTFLCCIQTAEKLFETKFLRFFLYPQRNFI